VTSVRTLVGAPFPAPVLDEAFAISPDSRTISCRAVRAEADLWIMERH
jgi:hypothetical protein